MCKVSVIIPVYNAEKYIKETVFSVLNQTYKDFELIVVDDGSTDNTYNIVKNILRKPHKIIKKDNRGEASARNLGLELAKGDYISFLDADDLYVYDKLEKQMGFLDNNSEFDMVYGSYNYIMDENFANWKNWNFKIDNNGSGNIFIKQFLENKICIITTLVRKECFDKVGFFDESIPYASDSDMWIRISADYKIKYLDQKFAYYRLHTNNVSLDRETCILHRIKSLKKNYKLYKQKLADDFKINTVIRPLYFTLMKNYIKQFKFKSALNKFLEYLSFIFFKKK